MQTLLFNPWNDLALAANAPHYTPPASARQMAADLAGLSSLWADTASVLSPYPMPWGWSPLQVRLLREAGVPEERLPTAEQIAEYRACSSREKAVSSLAALRQTLAAREDCVPFLERIAGESVWCMTEEEVRTAHGRYGESMLKAPWSGSGRGVHPAHGGVLDAKTGAWVRRTLARQGGIEVEPMYNKVQDLAMEFWAEPQRQVRYEGLSLFATTDGGVYDGNIVASEEEKEARVARLIPLPLLDAVRDALMELLGMPGMLASWYRGPVGVDMMVVDNWVNPDDMAAQGEPSFALHPFVELNHRMTMGWLACRFFQREPEDCRLFRIVQEQGRYRYELTRVPDSAN